MNKIKCVLQQLVEDSGFQWNTVDGSQTWEEYAYWGWTVKHCFCTGLVGLSSYQQWTCPFFNPLHVFSFNLQNFQTTATVQEENNCLKIWIDVFKKKKGRYRLMLEVLNWKVQICIEGYIKPPHSLAFFMGEKHF